MHLFLMFVNKEFFFQEYTEMELKIIFIILKDFSNGEIETWQ